MVKIPCKCLSSNTTIVGQEELSPHWFPDREPIIAQQGVLCCFECVLPRSRGFSRRQRVGGEKSPALTRLGAVFSRSLPFFVGPRLEALTRVYVQWHGIYTHVHMHARTYTHANIDAHMHTQIQTYTCTRIHTHAHAHANIHAHMHTYTYAHENIHAHMPPFTQILTHILDVHICRLHIIYLFAYLCMQLVFFHLTNSQKRYTQERLAFQNSPRTFFRGN